MKLSGLALLLALSLPLGAAGADRPHAEPVPAAVDAAPVALLVDLTAGQTLYARKTERRFLPASMTKAMSALVAFDLIAAGKLDESATFIVAPETAAQWAGKGTSLYLQAGEHVRVSDLLMGLTTVSANDAATVLAQGALGSTSAWVARMNAKARALGMSGSHFGSPNGWPDGGATHVTARDLVVLAKTLIEEHPVLYRRYFGHATMNWHGQNFRSHDPFAGVVPGADGIKTGHTNEAGYNFLGAVERRGRRLVLVIGGAQSEPARAIAARDLLEWGYSAWNSRPLLRAGKTIGEARVQGGSARNVPLRTARAWSLAVPRGTAPRISARIVYRGPIEAPILRGHAVAGLEIEIAGQPAHVIPLVAARDVGRAGPIDRLVNGLLGLFE